MSCDEALVLAAGKGTRMRSNRPKVLHHVAGKPMLARVLHTLADAGFPCPAVVVGFGADDIERVIGDRCRYVIQDQLLGTGHAARVGMDALPAGTQRVLVVHGDEPLIEPQVYRSMLACQEVTGAAVVLLTTHSHDLRDFGRLIRDEQGVPAALIQKGDLTPQQEQSNEVNLGAYVFDVGFLRSHLHRLETHPPGGEYYLTDLIEVAARAGKTVEAITIPGGEDVMGINDLVHLEHATRAIYRRTNRRLMEQGVTIVDSAGTFIDDDAKIAADTVIHPFTIIAGACTVGTGCEIGPGSHIISSTIGDACHVFASTVRDSTIQDHVSIGPYAHVRGGARIGNGVQIGSYAEIKRSTLGAGTKMHHFGYLGDAEIGVNVNIGAGVITCNFDGVAKHRTLIGDNAFIGSDTMLRAPLEVGAGAYTGAGSVVTKNVPPGVRVVGMPARVIARGEEPKPEEERGA